MTESKIHFSITILPLYVLQTSTEGYECMRTPIITIINVYLSRYTDESLVLYLLSANVLDPRFAVQPLLDMCRILLSDVLEEVVKSTTHLQHQDTDIEECLEVLDLQSLWYFSCANSIPKRSDLRLR